jgi:hypothetical protein
VPSPEPAAPPPLETADDVAALVQALYGARALPASGVLHVASAWDGPDTRHVLRVTDESPKSAYDAFALHLARARADVIVTTGAILRAEPALRYDLGGDAIANGLEAYRREALGKAHAPALWLLTSGRDLDLDHPALSGAFPVTLVLPAEARVPSRPAHIARRDLPEGGLRALLRAEVSADRLVSVEAGPRTHRALYDPPAAIDELMLTLFLGELDVTLRGGETPGAAALEAALGPPRSDVTIDEPSGRFRFLRYRR